MIQLQSIYGYFTVKAEKLFDMPLTDYSEFFRVKRDFEGMQHIYKLYKQQKIGRENWSKTLWANLNPQMLTDGIEGYIKEYRKVPKWVSLNIHSTQIFLFEVFFFFYFVCTGPSVTCRSNA